jgi:chromosomal replication initiator protein
VLTTDRHPNELRGIKDRLISRFQSGLIVDIHAPDLETRIAILAKQAEDDGLDIPFEVTELVAFSVKNDVRRMKAVLIRLLALSSIKHVDITMEMAKQVLVDMLGKSAFNKVNINHVIKHVSKTMKVSERQLFGKGRTQNVALARQTAMFLARELTNLSLINIGSKFGGRDHSTVIHACKTIENKI